MFKIPNFPNINLKFISEKTLKAPDLSCFNQDSLVHEINAEL